MSHEHDELRTSLIAAVQAELNRHATAVNADLERLRDEAQREREALRASLSDHIRSLAGAVETSTATRDAFDKQLAQSEERTNRRVQELIGSIDGLVEAAARPLLTQLREEQDDVNRRIEGLAENLRRFDEQAARMVQFFDESMKSLTQRDDEARAELVAKVEAQTGELTSRIDTALIEAVRHKSETTQLVGQRVADLEERVNARILAAETRAKEDAGNRIADIDAHVGRVSAGLDATLTVVNDRVSGIEGRIEELHTGLEEMAAKVEAVDETALDELKEKLSSAVGEAMLVRIEMERLDKAVGEKLDGITVRVTDVETQLADQTMDVSTAVQLERLEELERAVAEIDPTTFVKKSELDERGGRTRGFEPPNDADDHDLDQMARILNPPLHAE
jgi:hypothetical protein